MGSLLVFFPFIIYRRMAESSAFGQQQKSAHPAVRPSILAKQHAAVYDFLLDGRKTVCEACMILDIPGRSKQETAEYFCHRINNENFRKIHFSFDGVPDTPRIILCSDTADVLRLVNDFLQTHPA